MERSTKRSEKRSRRLKHEAENAFTFPCLALYFRFMKYTLHFGFELDIVFPFLHVRFIFLVQTYDLNVWFLASAFSLLKPEEALKRVLGECSCADLALVAVLFVGF